MDLPDEIGRDLQPAVRQGGDCAGPSGGEVHEQGREEERDQAILIFIEDKLEDNISVEIIENKLNKRYDLSSDKAKEYIERASAIMKEKSSKRDQCHSF